MVSLFSETDHKSCCPANLFQSLSKGAVSRPGTHYYLLGSRLCLLLTDSPLFFHLQFLHVAPSYSDSKSASPSIIVPPLPLFFSLLLGPSLSFLLRAIHFPFASRQLIGRVMVAPGRQGAEQTGFQSPPPRFPPLQHSQVEFEPAWPSSSCAFASRTAASPEGTLLPCLPPPSVGHGRAG